MLWYDEMKSEWAQKKKGHKYTAKIKDRVRGSGCLICSHKRIEVGKTDLLSQHADIATQWHYFRNKIGPDKVFANSNNKYWWICSNGHNWRTEVDTISSGTKGPECYRLRLD